MPEPVDVYCDQFQVSIGPWGSALNFSVSSPTPPAPGAPSQAERLATIRMSLEHLKVMAFILRRHMIEYERGTGITVEIPREVLNGLQIGQEDWEKVWRQ